MNVKPDTFIWHRKGFRLFWRRKSRPPGRPRLPKDLRRLIREMGADNPTWGEERIANELKLKLSIQVSPRTVGKYLRNDRPTRTPDPKQRYRTFVRDHAKVMLGYLPIMCFRSFRFRCRRTQAFRSPRGALDAL